MKTNKKYEGKNYKFKRNSILKTKIKYDETYHQVIKNTLKYKKYINNFEKLINIDNTDKFNKLLLEIMESTAKELDLNNNKVYNYSNFNKKLVKSFYKATKLQNKNTINLKVINTYKMIENRNYKDLRELAFKKPKDFLKALYLYTICED